MPGATNCRRMVRKREHLVQHPHHVGMEVRTLEGKRLGRISKVSSGTFQVARGFLLKKEYSLSFDEVVWAGDDRVVLTVSRSQLDDIRAHGGIGTTLGERTAGAADHLRVAIDDAVHIKHATGPNAPRG
jgi:hypothetical protein